MAKPDTAVDCCDHSAHAEWFRAWRRRRKEPREERPARRRTPTWREAARQNAAFVFLLSGLLFVFEAGLMGLFAGFVINEDWQIDLSGIYVALLLFVVLAFLAFTKRKMDRFVDTMPQLESDDERFKRLIREVLDERSAGSEAQPEASD